MSIDILVRGKNMTVDDAVGAAARRKVAKLERFAHDIHRIEVEFSEVRNPRVADSQVCTVTIHLKRRALKAHAAAPQPAAALDLVVDKAEHQLHRLKDKRVEH